MLTTPKFSDIDPMTLDYSMLTHADLVNIVLQRSETISDVGRPGNVIRAWMRGDPGPLDRIVADKGVVLAQRAVAIIAAEFEVLRPTLDRFKPKRIADIGCGYAFFDLFVHHCYGSELLLNDLEQNERRHFGFKDEAAAYSSLQTARAFLTANGVPGARITCWNPEDDTAETGAPVDLAFSFLSCGFHFPVDMYLPFFRYGVTPQGGIILDLRAKMFSQIEAVLSVLGPVEVLVHGKGYKRVLVRKGG